MSVRVKERNERSSALSSSHSSLFCRALCFMKAGLRDQRLPTCHNLMAEPESQFEMEAEYSCKVSRSDKVWPATHFWPASWYWIPTNTHLLEQWCEGWGHPRGACLVSPGLAAKWPQARRCFVEHQGPGTALTLEQSPGSGLLAHSPQTSAAQFESGDELLHYRVTKIYNNASKMHKTCSTKIV